MDTDIPVQTNSASQAAAHELKALITKSILRRLLKDYVELVDAVQQRNTLEQKSLLSSLYNNIDMLMNHLS